MWCADAYRVNAHHFINYIWYIMCAMTGSKLYKINKGVLVRPIDKNSIKCYARLTTREWFVEERYVLYTLVENGDVAIVLKSDIDYAGFRMKRIHLIEL